MTIVCWLSYFFSGHVEKELIVSWTRTVHTVCFTMDMPCAKGDRILLTDSRSQMFSGVVKSLNANLGRILLADVLQLPENKSISGYRNFDRNEIVEVRKIEDDKPVENQSFAINVPEAVEPETNKVVNDEVRPKNEEPELKLSELEYDGIKKLQREYRYIRDFGTNFHCAISQLKTCSAIGVYAKDVSKGRFERASVLAISSPGGIFVFDLQALGGDAFLKGLKDILESPGITKVVHDCRLLSDCLKHKHLINLENIRDVEAEDIMVVFQERRTIRRHSRTLEYLCRVYLGVEVEGCEDVGDVWKERPLPSNLLEGLVSLVSFLVPLQEVIERKYLQLLVDASNIYNKHVRSLDFFDILYDDQKKTLRSEMNKLLVPQIRIRSDCRFRKING